MPRKNTFSISQTKSISSRTKNINFGDRSPIVHHGEDEDTKKASRVLEKRRAQNRDAQRRHREKLKRKVEALEQYVRNVATGGKRPDLKVKTMADIVALNESSLLHEMNGVSHGVDQTPLLQDALNRRHPVSLDSPENEIHHPGFKPGEELLSSTNGSFGSHWTRLATKPVSYVPMGPSVQDLGGDSMYMCPWNLSYAAMPGLKIPQNSWRFGFSLKS